MIYVELFAVIKQMLLYEIMIVSRLILMELSGNPDKINMLTNPNTTMVCSTMDSALIRSHPSLIYRTTNLMQKALYSHNVAP